MSHARTANATPRRRPIDPTAGLPPLHRNAAGSDVGRAEHSVAVPPERSPEPVRRCASCTADLHALADWRHACHIETVVMERTGVYGIPRFHILEARGLEVHLVNARQATHVPGRTPDSADGPWLQNLHTCGRLNRSCRPRDAIGV